MSPGWRRQLTDDAWQAGCQIVAEASALWAEADIVLKVRPPDMQSNLGKHEVELLCEGGTLISFIWPAQSRFA